MEQFEYFKTELDAGVALVTMNRPAVNAIDRQLREQCIALFSALGDDPAVRAIVLTGAGKMFSAGADLKDRPDSTRPGAYPIHNRSVRECFQSVMECAKPVIAAINGPAIGAGLVLASCCDILLAQTDAWVSMPEVEVGLAGGVRHVLRHFGQSDARLMMYTARRIPAPELLRMGVLSACLPADKLVEGALDIAREIASKSPMAVSAAKASFLVTDELTVHSGYRWEQSQTVVLSQGADATEARLAFSEKRKPVFPLRK